MGVVVRRCENRFAKTVEERDMPWLVRVVVVKGSREGSDVEMIEEKDEETVEEKDMPWLGRVVVVKGSSSREGSDVETVDDPTSQSLLIRIRNPRENRQSNVGLSRTSTICRFG